MLENVPISRVPEEVVLSVTMLSDTPVTATKVAKWTARDPVLSHVKEYTVTDWPHTVSDDFQPYYNRRSELSVHLGCLLWGSRVVIPIQGRETLLDELHEGHPGVVRMKALARSYFWWPGLDNEIELRVKSCVYCQQHQK